MNNNSNLLERVSIDKYRNTMRRMLSLYYPDLTKNDIEAAINYSITKRYKQERCELDNDYTKKKASGTLLDMTDYIITKKPIMTGWGVLFEQKGIKPNPLTKMIGSFMDLREIHKDLMFQFPKGSEEFEKYKLLQLLNI